MHQQIPNQDAGMPYLLYTLPLVYLSEEALDNALLVHGSVGEGAYALGTCGQQLTSQNTPDTSRIAHTLSRLFLQFLDPRYRVLQAQTGLWHWNLNPPYHFRYGRG
jgi:hypothetical protein